MNQKHIFQITYVATKKQSAQSKNNEKTLKFALITSLFCFASVISYAAEVDSVKLSFAIEQEVAED